MKVIVAGGRDFTNYAWLKEVLDSRINKITEVVCGCARGADTLGAQWAIENFIPVKEFPADWNQYGKRAGHIRNGQMANYAQAAVLFPGNRGTNDMYAQAVAKGLAILDLRFKTPENWNTVNTEGDKS